jgi:hypothetical protein
MTRTSTHRSLTRSVDVLITGQDRIRFVEAKAWERAEVDRQFAPIKAKIAANAQAMAAPRTWALY